MNNAPEIYKQANSQLYDLDIPTKEVVETYTLSTMQMVVADLADNNFHRAIDTLDKVQCIEDYINAKVAQEKADLVTQNLIAACRFRIMRELGEWLTENLSKGCVKGRVPIDGKPIWFLEDIHIDRHKSHYYQRIAALPKDEFENFLRPYITPSNGKVNELYFKTLWKFANPKKPSEKQESAIPMEAELSHPGMKLYKLLLEVRSAVVEYFKFIKSNGIALREVGFMAGVAHEYHRGLASVEVELRNVKEGRVIRRKRIKQFLEMNKQVSKLLGDHQKVLEDQKPENPLFYEWIKGGTYADFLERLNAYCREKCTIEGVEIECCKPKGHPGGHGGYGFVNDGFEVWKPEAEDQTRPMVVWKPIPHIQYIENAND